MPDSDEFLNAVRSGDLATVRRLLESRPELADCGDQDGRSVLVLAFIHGHRDVAETLIKTGLTLDLTEAAMAGDWERAETLALANPDQLNQWHVVGGTPVYGAARSGQSSLWRLQFWGAELDANPRGVEGVSPAYGALECVDPVAARLTLTDILSNGGTPNVAQRGADSLLHAAARRGDVELVRLVLRKGGAVGARDAQGRTALDVATRAGHEAVARLLSHPTSVPRDDFTMRDRYNASGEPVQWPDLSDLSASDHSAVTSPAHFSLQQVREIVDADPRRAFCRSVQNELAVEACGHTGNQQVLRYLLDHGVPQSLATSLSVGDLDRAHALLEEHPDAIFERGPHDFPMLWYAAIGGDQVEAAELLLDFGADVSQESLATTALHVCAARGRRELAAYLIDQGADLNAVGFKDDRSGQTPLAVAVAAGQTEMVKLLKERGARV